MRVKYDKNIKIVGIGVVPWSRFGLEKFLPNYKIITLNDCDFSGKNVICLSNKNIKPSFKNIVNSDDFKEIYEKNFQDYRILTYKSFEKSDEKFISGDFNLAKNLENKAYFRRNFSNIVNFADYKILDKNKILKENANQLIFDNFHDHVVIQDSIMSGGRGTFKSSRGENIIQNLEKIGCFSGKGGEIIVSKLLKRSFERSIQAVICKDRILIGPLQNQIVADENLTNIDGGSEKFCGIQISTDDKFAKKYDEFSDIVKKIGEKIKQMGYRGVFGVDFLVSDDEIFVLEVNPRLTGATPLLTQAFSCGEIPFQLLHILELGDYDYQIEGDPKKCKESRSTIIIHGKNHSRAKIIKTLPSGIYDFSLNLISESLEFEDLQDGQVLIQQQVSVGDEIRDGGRLFIANFKNEVLDENDKLKDEIKKIVGLIHLKIKVEEVE